MPDAATFMTYSSFFRKQFFIFSSFLQHIFPLFLSVFVCLHPFFCHALPQQKRINFIYLVFIFTPPTRMLQPYSLLLSTIKKCVCVLVYLFVRRYHVTRLFFSPFLHLILRLYSYKHKIYILMCYFVDYNRVCVFIICKHLLLPMLSLLGWIISADISDEKEKREKYLYDAMLPVYKLILFTRVVRMCVYVCVCLCSVYKSRIGRWKKN